MKRKYIIIILCLLLVITGCKNKKKDNKNNKIEEVKWEVVEGKQIENNPYTEFETDEYIDNYFVTTYSKTVYKYLIPKDYRVSSVDFVSTFYSSSSMLVSIDDVSLDNVDDYLEKITEDYKGIYDEVYVENKKIDNDMFISHATNLSFSDGGTFYRDELNIFVHDTEEEWNVLHYTLLNSKMDDKLINKLVKGFSKLNEDTNLRNCKSLEGNYRCSFSNIGGRTIDLDLKKSGLELVGFLKNDNYNISINGFDRVIKVGVIYYDDKEVSNGLDNTLFSYYKAPDVNVNGKTFNKYFLIENEDDEEFRSYDKYYIYMIDNNTALYIYNETATDNDDVLSAIVDVNVR